MKEFKHLATFHGTAGVDGQELCGWLQYQAGCRINIQLRDSRITNMTSFAGEIQAGTPVKVTVELGIGEEM